MLEKPKGWSYRNNKCWSYLPSIYIQNIHRDLYLGSYAYYLKNYAHKRAARSQQVEENGPKLGRRIVRVRGLELQPWNFGFYVGIITATWPGTLFLQSDPENAPHPADKETDTFTASVSRKSLPTQGMEDLDSNSGFTSGILNPYLLPTYDQIFQLRDALKCLLNNLFQFAKSNPIFSWQQRICSATAW